MKRYDCPHCEHTDSARVRLVDHVRTVHDPTFRLDAAVAVDVDAQRQWTRIACRTCARDTERTDIDPIFRHVDDRTPACVDPDTLTPYPTQTGENPMTSTVRIRPTTAALRDWYSSLSDEQRTAARAHVVTLIDDGETTQGAAWVIVRDAHDLAASPVFDRIVHPTVDVPGERVCAEHNVVIHPDEIGCGECAPTAVSDATAPAERTRGRQPALVSYWMGDKPKRNLSDLAYDATGGLVDDAPRMTAAQFRDYLTSKGIDAPESTAWSLDLPNGKTVRTTLRDQQSSAA